MPTRGGGAYAGPACLGLLMLLGLGRSAPATPHLDYVQARLRPLAPNAEGRLWGLTGGNALTPDARWLIQTPDCWGLADPDTDCARRNAPGARAFADQIREDIAAAEDWVDITTLAFELVVASGIFRDAIVDGIRQARSRQPNITIRILAGTAPTKSDGVSKAYLAQLLKDLGDAAEGARIFVAGVETYWTYSWNHAKIIAVDGRSAIVGGHNLWDEAYNSDHPVNDVSMRVEGPAASMAHNMADLLWEYVCTHEAKPENVGFARSPAVVNATCPSHYAHTVTSARGDIPMLAMGMLGYGMDSFDNTSGALPPADDSEAACSHLHKDYINEDARFSVDNPDMEGLRALIDSAQDSVFLAQQDLVLDYCTFWNSGFVSAIYDARLFESIARKLAEEVPVTIVVSTPTEVGNADGYSYMQKLTEIPNILLRKLEPHLGTAEAARESLCKHLRLASVRIAPNMSQWESGFAPALHSKVVEVDGVAFYVGSHNSYPTTLQEFGYIVEDAAATAELRVSFLDKLWSYSQETAIVDFGASRCELPKKLPRDSGGRPPQEEVEASRSTQVII